MNVTSTRFATKTRTWLLIAALTALLIGIGALLGGMFLYAFVALAAIVNVVGYWFLDSGPLGWIGLIATLIFAPLAASLLQLGVSRQREYLADATGAELLGRARPLADALETLERRAQTVPLDVNPATASHYIVNPLRRQGVATLFSTHPAIVERVRRLRALDGDFAPRDARTLLEARTQ